MHHRTLLPVLGLALAGSTAAQSITNLDTGAQYTALQAAIDAANSGARLGIAGGSHGAVVITKSITLIGDQGATIASAPNGGCTQPPAITIRGGGADRVSISGLTIGGTATWPTCTPGAGISATGLAELRVYRSSITGHVYTGVLTGILVSAPGIHVPTGAPLIVLSDCVVDGTASDSDGTQTPTPQGGAAIDAPGASVVAVGSTLTAGDGGDSFLISPVQPTACPCAWGTMSYGGDAVVADEYWHADTTEVPGRGGRVFVLGVSWGQQPDGQPVIANSVDSLGFSISATAPPRLGQMWSLQFVPVFGSASALVVGDPAAPQPFAGAGWLCIDPNGVYSCVALGSQTPVSFPVPTQTAVLGVEFAAQVATVWASQALLSRPIFEQVTF